MAPHVTDHAVLRYLERVAGVDVEALRKAIVPDSVAPIVAKLGDGRYPVRDRDGRVLYSLRVRRGVVVTIRVPLKRR